MSNDPKAFAVDIAALASLKPHPRNYRDHPDDQLDHIIESIKQHGFYRNVVVARDNTILAGHGVVKAAAKMGLKEIPVRRMDCGPDDPVALKLLAGDNEIGRLALVDDRRLTEMLKELRDSDNLLGTGFDDMMLANLLMVTRTESEVRDFDAAAEYVGMPDYEPGPGLQPMLNVMFRTPEDRDRFIEGFGIKVTKRMSKQWAAWWPAKEQDDLSSLEFK